MATRMEFRKLVRDYAKLEGEAVIAIGTTGFAGDGDRLFLNFKEVGILFSHEDARAFLRATARAAKTLDYGDDPGPEETHGRSRPSASRLVLKPTRTGESHLGKLSSAGS